MLSDLLLIFNIVLPVFLLVVVGLGLKLTNIINDVGNIINYQRTSVVDHIIHTYGLTKEEVENYYIVLGYGLKLERKLGDFFNSL
jgi:hypothetical protein